MTKAGLYLKGRGINLMKYLFEKLPVVKQNEFYFRNSWLPGSGTDGLATRIW